MRSMALIAVGLASLTPSPHAGVMPQPALLRRDREELPEILNDAAERVVVAPLDRLAPGLHQRPRADHVGRLIGLGGGVLEHPRPGLGVALEAGVVEVAHHAELALELLRVVLGAGLLHGLRRLFEELLLRLRAELPDPDRRLAQVAAGAALELRPALVGLARLQHPVELEQGAAA